MNKLHIILSLSTVLLSHSAVASRKPLQDQSIWPSISAHCKKPLSVSTWHRGSSMTFDQYQKIALANRNHCIEQYYAQKNKTPVTTPMATQLNTAPSYHIKKPTETRINVQTLKKSTTKNNTNNIHWY